MSETSDTGEATNPYGLDPQRWRFCQEYLTDFIAKRAAIRAGYGERNAQRTGSRLLADPECKRAIRGLLDEQTSQWQATRERIVQELMAIAFANMKEFAYWGHDAITFIPSEEITDAKAAAITEIRKTIDKNGTVRMSLKLGNKLEALKMLGQHIGMFREVTSDDARGAFQRWADAKLNGEEPAVQPREPEEREEE